MNTTQPPRVTLADLIERYRSAREATRAARAALDESERTLRIALGRNGVMHEGSYWHVQGDVICWPEAPAWVGHKPDARDVVVPAEILKDLTEAEAEGR